jgi:glycosyltransferase involved in cell wall biosynthesis
MSGPPSAVEPRVLLLVDRLEVGGPGRLAVSLGIGLRRQGVDVRVAHLGLGDWGSLAAELAAGGVPVFNLRLGRLHDPRPVVRLAAYVHRERIDVVHTHNRYAHLVGRAGAALARRPIVSTVHYLRDTEPGWREAIRRWLDHASARVLCSAVITVSDAQRQAYQQAAGMESARLETHRHGVDATVFRPDPAARDRLRRTFGLDVEALLFTTVAMLRPGKGLEYLLQAVAKMRSRTPVARVLIVGDGEERPKLETLVAALGLTEVVRFVGVRSDVPGLLAAADVYVHPSLSEALPISVLEAMAVGLPVVASSVGGIPEIVADEQTGMLVPPAHADQLAAAMLRLLDPGLRATMGAAGRAWVETHATTRGWLESHRDLYRRVAAPA